ATHAGEAPATTKRKKREYNLWPDRPKPRDLIKVVPLEWIDYITPEPLQLATFVHSGTGVFFVPLPWAPLRNGAPFGRPALAAAALIPILISTVGCGSSTTTSVAAPSSTSSPRCQANVSSSTPRFAAAGGTGTLSITVARDCTWNATSQVAWIAITSAASGQGDGTIGFRVSANADPVGRDGVIAISDKQVTVGQDAA